MVCSVVADDLPYPTLPYLARLINGLAHPPLVVYAKVGLLTLEISGDWYIDMLAWL